MEEHVGVIWDRLITRAARRGFPEAAVSLNEMARTLGVFFRALGGDGGLRVEAAEATPYYARRDWLQRIAGSGRRVELAWRDEHALRLPARLDLFPERELNRSLYLWLAALASADRGEGGVWIERNQRLSTAVLARYPGLVPRYRALVAAYLPHRPDPAALPPDEAAQEAAIQAALREPGSISRLPPARYPPHPVHLWLHPAPSSTTTANHSSTDAGEPAEGGRSKTVGKGRRRKAERVDQPENKGGLFLSRLEQLLGGFAEFVKVDRGTEENDDLDDAETIAEDLDVISVTQDQHRVASRVRFDLDLPSEASDDRRLGDGITLPEWDYRKSALIPDYCLLQPMEAALAGSPDLPPHLHRLARRLRNQFQALAPSRMWYKAQPDGSEIDLDAYERFVAQRASGQAAATDGRLYKDFRGGGRDLACLLLADLSLSTDAWINNHARVIDVIRDSLYLFGEALNATGDRFGLYGFSSRHRDHVRFHHLKRFDEPYGGAVRGRLAVLKPGYYTRMGAAIRHATRLLAEQPATRRLLLILTDGKPNDLDRYEGRYGIEDTRMAVLEARREGLQPFCVTIDDEGGDYLPHLFGSSGFVIVRRPADLPRQLPLLYAQLTA